MKIGLVCPHSVAQGGVQEIVRALRTELIRRGHDVKVITPQPRDIANIDTEGVIFVGSANDFRSPLGTTSQVSASIDNEALEQMLETEKFDILHFHEPWVPFLSRQILTRSNSVNIGTFHAKVPETLMSRTIVKVVTPYTRSELKYLHELTAVSEAAAEYAGSLTDRPIAIIPNGIDLNEYKVRKPESPSADSKTILYLGRIERRKGLKYLLRAYQLLVQRVGDVSLVIAGDGPEREKMEEYVSEMQLPNVTFLGFVSHSEKKQLLASADLYCTPAIYGESFGIVLLEAMACGVVTVAGDNSGYASVMKGTGTLSLVNPHDSVEFARRLELLLTDETVRNLWKKWAKQYVKQFSYPTIVDEYEELYVSAYKQYGNKSKKS